MVLFSPKEIRKGNLVCQSRTQKMSWSTELILNTLSRVTELKEITESFSCEFWHDSQQTLPHLNSQERGIIKGRVYSGTQSLPGCPRRGGQSQCFPRTPVTHCPSPSWVLFQPDKILAVSCGSLCLPAWGHCSCSSLICTVKAHPPILAGSRLPSPPLTALWAPSPFPPVVMGILCLSLLSLTSQTSQRRDSVRQNSGFFSFLSFLFGIGGGEGVLSRLGWALGCSLNPSSSCCVAKGSLCFHPL